jgi:hypothetical protein
MAGFEVSTEAIIAERHGGPGMGRARGLSIYFPPFRDPSAFYRELDFARRTPSRPEYIGSNTRSVALPRPARRGGSDLGSKEEHNAGDDVPQPALQHDYDPPSP